MPALQEDTTAALSTIWRQIINDVADRNAGVELMPWHVAEGEGTDGDQRFRVRLLAAESDGRLVVQQPANREQRRWLELGAWIGVLLVFNNQRWLGRCRVIETADRFSLNATTHVAAIKLDAASEVRSSQRRSAFRANTAAIDLSPARLASIAKHPPGQPPAHVPPPVEAQLLNISISGLGLAVDPTGQHVQQLLQSRRYQCQFTLPGFDDAITVIVRLIHARPQQNRTVYLGLQFEFNDPGQQRQFEDRLARFTSHLERETLRKRRGS
ncbi:PilZ domain-containing protein [Phycisphaerales bacterium AB-hyl4]|uniref:PilZ domain-containing protein n=1 Tax=Natronomicrosphaera hydrolytica TaxID=3242702 RepID=A0ABV4U1K0_9BACT